MTDYGEYLESFLLLSKYHFKIHSSKDLKEKKVLVLGSSGARSNLRSHRWEKVNEENDRIGFLTVETCCHR